MNSENRMMSQISNVFGAFMTLFYLGVGMFLMVADYMKYYDKVLRIIVGVTFILYGVYRGFRTWSNIRKMLRKDDTGEEKEGRFKYY